MLTIMQVAGHVIATVLSYLMEKAGSGYEDVLILTAKQYRIDVKMLHDLVVLIADHEGCDEMLEGWEPEGYRSVRAIMRECQRMGAWREHQGGRDNAGRVFVLPPPVMLQEVVDALRNRRLAANTALTQRLDDYMQAGDDARAAMVREARMQSLRRKARALPI